MEIISLILTSTAIGATSAAIVTSLANKSIQKSSFKNDYFKTVIEYRINSYSRVWNIFSMFPYKYRLGDPYVERQGFDDLGAKSYHEIDSLLREISFDSYWLSQKMREEVIAFHLLISSYYDPYNGSADEEVRNMIDGMPKIKEHLIRIQSIYTLDMENIYDVPIFFDAKKRAPTEVWPKYFSDAIG